MSSRNPAMKPHSTADRRAAHAAHASTSRPRDDDERRTAHRSARASAMGTAAELRERRTERREVRERETEVPHGRSG